MSHRSNSKDSTDCNHNRERKLLVANNTNNLLKFVASEEAEKEDGATVNSNNTNTSKKKISSSPLVKHTSGTNNNNNGLFYASTTTTNSEELFLIHSSSLLEASLHRPHSNNTSNSSSFSMSSDPLRQNNNIYVKELVKELREIYLDLHRNENKNKNNMTREDLFNMIEVLQFPVEDVGLFIDLFDELLLVKQNIFQHFDSAAHNGSLSVNTAPTNNNNNNKGNASSTIASGNAALPPAAPRPPALNANSFPSSTEREMFLQGGSSKSNNSMANHKDNEDTLDVETFLAHVVLRIKGKFSSESLRTLFFDLADKYNTSNNNNNNNNKQVRM
ncbi:hypothetical protein ADEAN_000856300 [Angomonas deanei]|uniref:Uncharacterized protein n=1 Tax=Angomonas deanei TaxID=59799 RepID=A0A7G2CMH2_9TRYP|nr:hypothetical protein ADEAN_000856300 [Angomonas deanei]